MISLRQHVVTIVAIFLALALGMLAGSAFIQPKLVDQLREDVESQRRAMDELRSQVSGLRDRLAAEQDFNDAALPHLTEGRLLGQDVIVIAQDGVEDELVEEARQALEGAGATVIVLSARDTLAPTDPADQEALATTLGLPGADPAALTGLAAEALADRLASEGGRASHGDPDLLHELLTEGYLAPVDANLSDATLATIGGAEQMVVVLAGGQAQDPVMLPEAFAIPLTERLVELGLTVGAGESVDTAVPFVPVLRAGGTDGLVTVDDLDESRGGAALVLGLQRLLLTGDGGNYGVKDDAVPLPPMP